MNAKFLFVVLLAIYGWGAREFGNSDLINCQAAFSLSVVFWPHCKVVADDFFPHWAHGCRAFLVTTSLRVLIGLVTSRIAWSTTPVINGSPINKFLGIIPGFINGVVYATVIAALLLALPLWDDVTKTTRNSQIASRLSDEVEWVTEKLSPVFDKAINQTINNLTIHPGSNESVKLFRVVMLQFAKTLKPNVAASEC
jgi:hypothetical protein